MTIRIAITPGEPAGIGPDLLIQLIQHGWSAQLVAIADKELLKQRAQQLGLPLKLIEFNADKPAQPNKATELYYTPVSYTHLTLPTIYSV